MYDFAKTGTDGKAALYADLLSAIGAITAEEHDPIANMANAAALIWDFLPDLNWAGFYRAIDGELVLGPFQGKAACIRIARGQGVCGTAMATRTIQCVENVHEFPGHIACDAASMSELVVLIEHEGRLIGVLDLDSPILARFDPQDVEGCAELMAVLGPRIAG